MCDYPAGDTPDYPSTDITSVDTNHGSNPCMKKPTTVPSCADGDEKCGVTGNGARYRGHQTTTINGHTCRQWSARGLSGHNYCRNPDHGWGKCNNGTDCSQPWCLYWKDAKKRKKLGWAYCDVGAPSASCPGKPSYAPADPVPLSWSGKSGASQSAHAEGHVKEHKYNYYSLSVPAALKGLLIVLVPTSSGPSPRLFADFDVRNPTGHKASYQVTSSRGGVSEPGLPVAGDGIRLCSSSAASVKSLSSVSVSSPCFFAFFFILFAIASASASISPLSSTET